MLVNPAQYTGFNFDRQNFRFNRENSCYMNYNLKLQSCYEEMPVWVTAVLFILLLKTGWFIQILKKQALKSKRSELKASSNCDFFEELSPLDQVQVGLTKPQWLEQWQRPWFWVSWDTVRRPWAMNCLSIVLEGCYLYNLYYFCLEML